MKVFTVERTIHTEGSVQKAGNPRLYTWDTWFSRLPPLPYMPDLKQPNWCFPLTNTNYCTMKMLIKHTTRIYYEEALGPAFEHSAPKQFREYRGWNLTRDPCIFKLPHIIKHIEREHPIFPGKQNVFSDAPNLLQTKLQSARRNITLNRV